jgi:branched-chain amino acid aminotransferase
MASCGRPRPDVEEDVRVAAEALIEFSREPHPAPTPDEVRAERMRDPGFGRIFTDHMVTIRWTSQTGWTDARLRPRAPLSLDPAAAVLHYAQEVFEGLKAYRGAGGETLLFRPEQNARRFAQSAIRLSMPAIPEELFLRAVEALVRADADWIPDGEGSLYLRPFMFASEAFLGVRPAEEYLFCIIASPVGAYFKGGPKPISLWAPDVYSRAGPGGTGAAKCGGNYAASLAAQAEAIARGCDQVIFLDAAEHRWIEELGGMNVFFVLDDDRLVTPPLTGTILPGITRESLLTLARSFGLSVEEAPYALETWRTDAASGRLREAFACGIAAVVVPIGEVRSADGAFAIPQGPLAEKLRVALSGLQRGALPDLHGWVRQVAMEPAARG